MEIRPTPLRVLLLLLLLGRFWWIGGFDLSATLPKGSPNARAMLYRIAMFVIGAGCMTIVEHEVGNLDRTSLRWLYILLGVILMAAAVTWTRALHGG